MKKLKKLNFWLMMMCLVLTFAGCGEKDNDDNDHNKEKVEESEGSESSSLITTYNWQNKEGDSLLVFEEDGSFRYYQSAEDMTDNYFEGTYLFYMGADAVTYLTTTLSDYGVTEAELTTLFDNNEKYDESNFILYILNNEACIMEGENVVETPYQTPYMGFHLEQEGTQYLDVANMNSANYYLYVSTEK